MINSIDKVLIVGFGSMGMRYFQILRRHYPKIKVKILRHSMPNNNSINDESQEFLYSTEEALSFKPNLAIIASPAPHHLKVSNFLAKQKVHLLIEKPISSNSKGLSDFFDFCNNQGIHVMTAYNLRFLPSLIEFRKLIEQNIIGKMLTVHSEVGQYLPSWRDSDYRKTVSAQRKLGGGVLLELSHEIDYLLWIFGPIDWFKAHITKQSDLEIDVEDTADIIFGFNKVSSHQLTGSLKMDFIRHDKTRFCEVIGEKGTLKWNGITGVVELFPKNGSKWKLLFSDVPDKDYTYLQEVKHFFSLITENKIPVTSDREGLDTIIAIEAIHKSNNINGKVYV